MSLVDEQMKSCGWLGVSSECIFFVYINFRNISKDDIIDILSLNTIRFDCIQVKQNNNTKKVSKMNQAQTENLPKIEVDYNSSRFDDLFREAVDSTFSTLGVTVKEAFFAFLHKKYNLSEEEIPDRISDFADGLEKIFGAGALLLELAIMKALRRNVPAFNYVAASSDLCFEAYVDSLRQYTEQL